MPVAKHRLAGKAGRECGAPHGNEARFRPQGQQREAAEGGEPAGGAACQSSRSWFQWCNLHRPAIFLVGSFYVDDLGMVLVDLEVMEFDGGDVAAGGGGDHFDGDLHSSVDGEVEFGEVIFAFDTRGYEVVLEIYNDEQIDQECLTNAPNYLYHHPKC